MILALLALAAPAAPDPAAVPVALSPLAQQFWAEGLRLEGEGRPGEAAVRFRAVRTADPAFGAATLALARVLAAQGATGEALGVLRERPYDPDAAQAAAELLERRREWSDAADTWRTVVALRPEWPGARVRRASALGRTDPPAAAQELATYLGFSGIDPVGDGLAPVVLSVAEALRSTARREEAAALVEQVLAVDPDEAGLLGDVLVRIEVDLAAEELARAGDLPLLPTQRATLEAARAAAARGTDDEARRLLEVLVIEAPGSAEAWEALSHVREGQGDAAGAEAATRAAMQLDPRAPEHPARLGDLLVRWFSGQFDGEAVAAYARALRRSPDDPELWWRRAEAERRAGRWGAAVRSAERVLALDPEGTHAADARRWVAGAGLRREPLPELPTAAGRPPALSEDAWRAYTRALAWRDREDVPWARDEALSELAYVRGAAPAWTPALLLEAAILAERGDDALASRRWEEARALDPTDPEPIARLAAAKERAGEGEVAARLWEEAADAGHPGALLRRAQAQAAAFRWLAARDTVDEVVRRAATPETLAEARSLRDSLDARTRVAAVGALALVLPIAAVPLAARWRRRSGESLDALVARSPGAWRDLARLVSAVQHEVVKHHFGLVGPVADALDDRDPGPARFAAERWFGPEGAVPRLAAYVAEIEALAARSGVRVNLRWRDPRFGPLLAAVERLRALEPALRSGSGRALAEELRALALPLGSAAHTALGELVDALCVTVLRPDVLGEAHARAAAEFPGRPVPAPVIAVPPGRVAVRMFRSELQDVLVNLVRNALEATPADGDATVALQVAVEEDPITFAERVVVAVADHAPGSLTTADLRGRHLSRGLGLAVDWVARAGGTIAVEPRPGYAKAVVVRIPRVEVT